MKASTFTKQLGLLLVMALSSLSLRATTCANAVNIPSAPVMNQALVCGAGDDLSSTSVPAVCGGATNSYKGGQEALYTFTPAASGNYIISISGQTWTSIFVYAGCPTSGGTCVNSVGSSTSSKSMTVALTAGTQYYIWFDTWPTPNSPCPGTFSLVAAPPPPANDNCAGAISLTVNADFACGVATTGTTASATQSTETAPSCSASGVNDDVWYSFTAAGAAHQIRITGATNTTAAAVYTGSCGALAQISGACASTSSGTANLNLTGLTAGTTYLVRVYTTASTAATSANFTICVGTPPPPPANDNCAGALPVAVNPNLNCTSVTMGTVASATASTGPSSSCGTYDDDVWFSFVATASTHFIELLNVTGSAVDLTHQVISSCGATTALVCSDPNTSTVSGLTPGQTYFIRVATWTSTGGQTTSFNVCVKTQPPPPANDNCAGALPVTVNPDLTCTSVTMGTVVSATASTGPSSSCGTYDDDVWFSFVATASTHLIELLNVTGSTTDLTHQVISSCAATTALVCSDPNTSTVSGLTPGQTYFIRVATWTSTGGQTTSFNVCVKTQPPPPANDDCAGAIALSVGASCSFAQYTTAAATGSVGAPAPGCASYSGGDVWFTAVVPATGRLVLDTNTGAMTDGGMAIYSGNCGVLTLIECDDDDSVNGLMPSIDRSGLTPGSTIYIRVWEYSNDNPGTFSICAYSPPPPCGVPGTPSASNVGTTGATLSWAAAGGAVSYRYSVGTAGHVCGTGSATTSGTSVNLTGLIPNTTYTFCVRTDDCGGGAASSYVSTTFTTAPLPNDACAGASTVTCGSTVTGSTVGASSDAGVGSCGSGSTPGSGVWYKLVGNGAQVTLDLCASAYDTKVHVFSGSCGGLSCVGSNDDSPVCGTSRSQFVFNASVGVDYYILVSGFGSATGAFSMSISCICGPNLGAPWTVSNIAGSNGGAIENVCDGTIDIKATGYGSPTSDVLTYASQQMCGNGFIQAKLENVTNGGWGGLMFRESLAAGSKKIAIRSQLTTAVVRDLRATTNGFAQQQQFPRPNTPQWMRLSRNGNIFTGEVSVDGSNWDVVFVTTLVLPNCIQVGLFTQSINVNTQATAVFGEVAGVPLTVVIPFAGIDNGLESTGSEQVGLSLYPNPAQDVLNVKLENFMGQPVRIEVRNALGQPVRALNLDEVTQTLETINLSGLPNGVYNLTLQAAGGQLLSKQFVIGQVRP